MAGKLNQFLLLKIKNQFSRHCIKYFSNKLFSNNFTTLAERLYKYKMSNNFKVKREQPILCQVKLTDISTVSLLLHT